MNSKNSFEQIIQPIAGYLDEVDRITRQKLTTGIPIVDGASGHLFAGGGKRIRASLIILSSGLAGGVTERTLQIASAAEIVHAATLIHDDIIDQSIMRRGGVTVPEKWGHKISVLAGDFMYTVSLDVAVKSGNPRIFPVIVDATKDMVKGELYQLQYSGIDAISHEHYMNIITLKTASFMAACCEMGALIADRDEAYCAKMRNFGMNLGYGFQIVDDLLDLTDQPGTTGKDSGNDLLDGKITLPAIKYMERLSEDQRASFIERVKNLTAESIGSMLGDIRESGAVEESREAAALHIRSALDELEKFPESEYRDILKEIAEFVLYRNY